MIGTTWRTHAQLCAILRSMPPRQGDEHTDQIRREVAARVRAAMGYAGLKLDDIVERCDLTTPSNIRRTVGARRDTPRAELLQIAAACDVPWAWFETGKWEVDSGGVLPDLVFGEGPLEHRVVVLETFVAVLARGLENLGVDVQSLLQDGAPQPASLAAPHHAATH